MLLRAANVLVREFLAPACVACDDVLAQPFHGPVCAACWQAVALVSTPWCTRCGDELPLGVNDRECARCRDEPPIFTIARSAGRYDGTLRAIIHAFKYQHRRPLARALAAMMARAGTDVLTGADAVVPVPLHPWRALSRGFNQADDLATQLGLPVWRVLHRRTLGHPQANLHADRRRANVAGAFSARPRLFLPAPFGARQLRDRTIVVVDDVMTTGATVGACSQALIDAGVKEVRALTVARAVATRPALSRARHLRGIARHR